MLSKSNKPILITGASGFIGMNLLYQAPSDALIVATYFSSEAFLPFLKSLGKKNIIPFKIDLRNPSEVCLLKESYPEFDGCIYLAANGDPAFSTKHPLADLEANTSSLVSLLQCFSFDKFIYFSSGAVYDHLEGEVSPRSPLSPTLPYAISNQASENYIRFFHDEGTLKHFLVLRFFGAFGPFEPERKIYTKLVENFYFNQNKTFTLRGDGENLIDAMYVEDTISTLLKIYDHSFWNQTVDFLSGTPITLKELVLRAGEVFGLQPEILFQGKVPECIHFFSKDDTLRKKGLFTPQWSLEEGLLKLRDHLRSIRS